MVLNHVFIFYTMWLQYKYMLRNSRVRLNNTKTVPDDLDSTAHEGCSRNITVHAGTMSINDVLSPSTVNNVVDHVGELESSIQLTNSSEDEKSIPNIIPGSACSGTTADHSSPATSISENDKTLVHSAQRSIVSQPKPAITLGVHESIRVDTETPIESDKSLTVPLTSVDTQTMPSTKFSITITFSGEIKMGSTMARSNEMLLTKSFNDTGVNLLPSTADNATCESAISGTITASSVENQSVASTLETSAQNFAKTMAAALASELSSKMCDLESNKSLTEFNFTKTKADGNVTPDKVFSLPIKYSPVLEDDNKKPTTVVSGIGSTEAFSLASSKNNSTQNVFATSKPTGIISELTCTSFGNLENTIPFITASGVSFEKYFPAEDESANIKTASDASFTSDFGMACQTLKCEKSTSVINSNNNKPIVPFSDIVASKPETNIECQIPFRRQRKTLKPTNSRSVFGKIHEPTSQFSNFSTTAFGARVKNKGYDGFLV